MCSGCHPDSVRSKLREINTQSANVALGLQKLQQAEEDVERMKLVLQQQKVELKGKEAEASLMLKRLEKGAREAGVQKDKADRIEANCKDT